MTLVAHNLAKVVLVEQATLAVPAQYLTLFQIKLFNFTIYLSFDSVPILRVPSGNLITTGFRNSSLA